MKGKRGVLKLWLTLVLVFAGLLAIVGVTVLTLFLMGRLSEEKVEAQDISFSQEFEEDEFVSYNGTVGRTSYYDVASNFRLTINTKTDNVTARKVTLSLNNGVVRNGKVSNGVITVPQSVLLNRSFAVELNRNPSDDEIAGGIAVLTARSENVVLESISARFNVDVPVSNIDVSVNENKPDEENEFNVVVGAKFNLNVEFSPNRSQYTYSSNQENPQTDKKKMVFFEYSTNYVSLNYDTNIFTASSQNSGGNSARITAYAFANAYEQQRFLNDNEGVTDKHALTERAIGFFKQNLSACVQKSIEVKVVDVKVETFEMANENPIHATVDKYFRLTANSSLADASLGLSVIDSNSDTQPQMFTFAGVRCDDKALQIDGGKIVKVNKDGTVEFDVKDMSDDEATYYHLPNTSPNSYGAYYWDMSSAQDFSGQLSVNLFYQDNGVWKKFLSADKSVNIDFTSSNIEESPAWLDTESAIDFVITYDDAGKVLQSSYDLTNQFSVSEQNVYRTTRIFLYSTDGVDLSKSFVCKAGESYVIDGQQRTLYELEGSVLTIIGNVSSSHIYVVVATVKTDASGKIVFEDGGKYTLKNNSSSKPVNVEARLSFANMAPSYTFDFAVGANGNEELKDFYGNASGAVFLGTETNGAENGYYYVPTMAMAAESSSHANLISFKLEYQTSSENAQTDLSKVIQAYQDGSLQIVCRSAGVESDDVKLQSLLADTTFGEGSGIETDGTLATLHLIGQLSIDESKFNPVRNGANSREISLTLNYDDGRNVHTKPISLTARESDADAHTESFYIYRQQPKQIKAEYENDAKYNVENKIDVTLSSGATTITWGDGNSIENLENLINLLTYKMFDQYGREINQNLGIYYIRMTESDNDNGQKVLNFNSNQTLFSGFKSTSAPTETSLKVYVVAGSGGNDFIGTDGMVTEEMDSRITSAAVNFKVTSEGVSKIKYDNNPNVKSTSASELTEETENLGTVSVRKYVVVGSGEESSFAINDLVKIYLGNNETDDEYVATLNMPSIRSNEQKINLMKVIQFSNNGVIYADGTPDEQLPQEFNKLGEITNFKLLSPLAKDEPLTLSFLLSGYTQNHSLLYRVDFNFTFLANTQVTNMFNNYQTEHNQYLKTSGEAGVWSVFGGVSGANGYDLDTFLPISITNRPTDVGTDISYTWASALNVADKSALFKDESGLCHLDYVNGKMYLGIDDVYRFTTINVTLRYGNSSALALYYTFTLFVNPNILFKVDNSSVKLDDFGSGVAGSGTNFKVYRATEFLTNGSGDITSVFFGNENLRVINLSDNKFLTFNESGNFAIKNQNADSTNFGIALNMDGVIAQKFRFQMQEAGGNPYYVDAILQDENGNVKLSDVLEGTENLTGLEVEFSIGVGKSDLVSAVFSGDVTPKQVTYIGKKYVLLLSGNHYEINDDYSLGALSGDDLNQVGENLQTAETTTNKIVFNTNNSITLLKNIPGVESGDVLQLQILLNAIVSHTGSDLMVFYDKMDATDLHDILGDGESGKPAQSQSLLGGTTYNILHESAEISNGVAYAITTDTEIQIGKTYYAKNGAGFEKVEAPNVEQIATYYEKAYGFHSKINETVMTRTFAVESDENGVVESLRNGELTLRHTKDESEVVLAMTISNNSLTNSFTYRYRITVLPTFEVGNVTYPFESGVEMLDSSSIYVTSTEKDSATTYTLDLNEKFNAQNSRFTTGDKTRFGRVSWLNGKEFGKITEAFSYRVSVDGDQLDDASNIIQVSIDENGQMIVTIKDFKTPIDLFVTKFAKLNDILLVGSELEYHFAFNQGRQYRVVITKGGESTTHTDAQTDITVNSNTNLEIEVDLLDESSTGQTPQPFNALIYGEGIEDYLNEFSFLEKGTTLTASEGGETLTLTEDLYLIEKTESATPDENYDKAKNEVTIGERTYKVDEGSIRTNHIKLSPTAEGKRTLTISPKSIKANKDFKIAIFTQEKRVFTINLTVTGSFAYELADNYVGGKVYGLTEFFNSITNNGEEIIHQTSKYHFVLTCASDYVYIVPDAEGVPHWVEFANLVKDQDIEFKLEIKEAPLEIASYTFTFSIHVAANLSGELDEDGNLTRTINDRGVKYLSNQEIEIYKQYIVTKFPEFSINEDISVGKFVFDEVDDAYSFKAYTLKQGDNLEGEDAAQDIVMKYMFNDRELFKVTISYQYTCIPNVEILTNYPKPNKEKEATYSHNGESLSAEYVSTTLDDIDGYVSKTFSNFFNESADFAQPTTRYFFRFKFDEGHNLLDLLTKNYEVAFLSYGRTWKLSEIYKNGGLYQIEDEVYAFEVNKQCFDYQTWVVREANSNVQNFLDANAFNSGEYVIEDKPSSRVYVDRKTNQDFDYSIKISEMENVNVRQGSTRYTEIGSTIDRFTGETIREIPIQFVLLSDEDGFVQFEMTVNNVTVAYYNVVVKCGANLSATINAPSYDNENGETLFAEDLASGVDTKIFATDRILTYGLAAGNNGTYYLKFIKSGNNEGDIKKVAISRVGTGKSIIDLGESFAGYKYEGTYSNASLTGEKLSDDSLYTQTPTLTSRVVITYEDGSTVALDEKTYMTYRVYLDGSKEEVEIEGDKKLSEFAFAQEYVDHTMKIEIDIKDGERTLTNSAIYNLKMQLDFDVLNNMDDYGESNQNVSYTTLQANGINSYQTLLGNFANEFRIISARTQANITADSLQNKNATLTLKEYGFSDLKVLGVEESAGEFSTVRERALSNAAYNFHNALIGGAYTDKVGVKYSLGLLPRSYTGEWFLGARDINNINNSDNTYNYIVIQKEQENDAEWRIYAQGANNDGNFVMMRLTYSVDLSKFGMGTVSSHHNILFKVEPNSQVYFRTSANSGTISAHEEVVDSETYASNIGSVYKVTTGIDFDGNKGEELYLFNDEDHSKSAITANMFGDSSKNLADSFEYSYSNVVGNTDVDYNSWTVFNNKNFKYENNEASYHEGWGKDKDNPGSGIHAVSGAGITKLSVTILRLELGEKHFRIDFKNKFGYQGRFYFDIVSDFNPYIDSVSNETLTEGDEFVVGSTFKELYPQTSTFNSNQYRKYEAVSLKGMTNPIITINYNKSSENPVFSKIDLHFELTKETAFTETIGEHYTAPAGTVFTFDTSVDFGGETTKDIFLNQSNDDDLKAKWKATVAAEGGDTAEMVVEADSTSNKQYAEFLSDATITTYIHPNTAEGVELNNISAIDKFSVSVTDNRLNGIGLIPDYSEGNETQHIHIPEENANIGLVTLGGVPAYGLKKELGALDIKGLEKYKSQVNTLVVTRVDWLLNGKSINPTASGYDNGKMGQKEGVNKDSELDYANIITNGGYAFVAKDNSIGFGHEMDTEQKTDTFQVPTFNTALFGENSAINNVTMRLTINNFKDGKADKELFATIDRNITIMRKAAAPKFTENVIDGERVSVASDSPVGGINIYNDTLEVTLDAGKSISFVVDQDNVEIAKDGETKLFDSSRNVAYVQATGAKFDENKTYYTAKKLENGQYQFSEVLGANIPSGDFDTLKTTYFEQRKLVTVTNTFNYKKTFYVGIHNSFTNIENNLTSTGQFYVQVYNGDEKLITYCGGNVSYSTYIQGFMKKSQYTTTSNDVARPLLRIFDRSELSNKSKTEKLYFLFNTADNNQTYRVSQSFNVHTAYSSVQAGNVATDGSFTLDKFYKASNKAPNESGARSYYVVTLEQWATGGNVQFKDATGATYEYKHDSQRVDVEGNKKWDEHYAYKLKFEADGAFVDEYGTLITSENYVLATGIITLKIYIKVSGADDLFDDPETNLLLGTLYIRLKETTFDGGELTTNTYDGDTVYIKRHNSKIIGVVICEKGFKLYKTAGDNESWLVEGCDTGTLLPLYTANVGEKIDLTDLLDGGNRSADKDDTGQNKNINYHIYRETTGSEDNGQNTTLVRDNLNTYTFTKEGRYTLSIFMTCRGIKNIRGFSITSTPSTYYRVTFIVTDKAHDEIEERDFKGQVNEDLAASVKRSGFTTYQLDDKGQPKEFSKLKFDKAGIYVKDFIHVSDSGMALTHERITFYIYNGATEQSVLYDGRGNFELSNLKDGEKVKFFKFTNDSMVEVTRETIPSSITKPSTIEYYVATYNDKDEITNFEQLNVTYIINRDDAQTGMAYVAESGDTLTSTQIEAAIKQVLNTEAGLTIYSVSNLNILTNVDGTYSLKFSNLNWLSHRFLVQYADGKTVTLDMTFYKYTGTPYSLEYATQSTTSFELQTLDATVRKMVGASEDAGVWYNQYNAKSNTLSQISYLNVQNNMDAIELYVRVNDGGKNTFYLFEITLSVYMRNFDNVDCRDDSGKLSTKVADIKNSISNKLVSERIISQSEKGDLIFGQWVDGKFVEMGESFADANLNLMSDDVCHAEVYVQVKDIDSWFRFVVTVRQNGDDVDATPLSMQTSDVQKAALEKLKEAKKIAGYDENFNVFVATSDSNPKEGVEYYIFEDDIWKKQESLTAFEEGKTYCEKRVSKMHQISEHKIAECGKVCTFTENARGEESAICFLEIEGLGFFKVSANIKFDVFDLDLLGNKVADAKNAICDVFKAQSVKLNDAEITADNITIFEIQNGQLSEVTTTFGENVSVIYVWAQQDGQNLGKYFKFKVAMNNVAAEKSCKVESEKQSDKNAICLSIANGIGDEAFETTADESKNANKTYYTKNEDGTYSVAELEGDFVADTTYYEMKSLNLFEYKGGKLLRIENVTFTENSACVYVQIDEKLYKFTITVDGE